MVEPANPDLRREVAAALDWWRDAGVDLDFRDGTASMLEPREAVPAVEPATKPVAAAKVPPSPAPAAPRIELAGMPDDLAAFHAWWMREPSLDGGRVDGRVPPRGRAGADLMVIVGDPERGDSDRLLSGPHGQLVDSFVAAAGISSQEIYVASVLPRTTPHADWPGIARAGYGAVLARHIAMVGPRRIVAFDSSNLPLTGNDWPNSPDSSRRFNHEGQSIPLYAARGLAALLERPRWKAGLWQGWLDLVRGN